MAGGEPFGVPLPAELGEQVRTHTKEKKLPRFTDEEKRAAVRRFIAGESQNSLAKELDVATSTFRSWRDKFEDEERQATQVVDVDPDEIRQVREQYAKAAEHAPEPRIRQQISPTGEVVETVLPDDGPDESADAELERLRREVEALKGELAQFHPEPVEWGWTEDAVRSNLDDHLDDLIANELAAINRDRLSNGYAPISPQDMSQDWYDAQVQRIVDEALDALDSSGADDLEAGWGDITATMRDNHGGLAQIVLSDGVGNGPAERIAALEAKGYKMVTPQPCARKDCWLEVDPQYRIGNLGFHNQIHYQLYVAFQGNRRTGVTTSKTFSI